MTKLEINTIAIVLAKYDACLLGEPFAYCGAFTDKKTCVECYEAFYIRKFGITNENGKHVKDCECQLCWEKIREAEIKKEPGKFKCNSSGCMNTVEYEHGTCKECLDQLPF
jgi:hypothetical protein